MGIYKEYIHICKPFAETTFAAPANRCLTIQTLYNHRGVRAIPETSDTGAGTATSQRLRRLRETRDYNTIVC